MSAIKGLNMSQYCGDDYDRMGCRAVVDVTKFGFRLAIFAPNGAPMEFYRAASAEDVARMLRDWCEGKKPVVSRATVG